MQQRTANEEGELDRRSAMCLLDGDSSSYRVTHSCHPNTFLALW